MTLPLDVKLLPETLGPFDIIDFGINVAPALDEGDTLNSYTVTLPTESVVLGLELNPSPAYSTTINNNVVTFWLGIAAANQNDPVFEGGGVVAPIEIEIVTNSVPPRKKKRTVAVTVQAK